MKTTSQTTSELVQRLRDYARNLGGPPEDYLTWQAADEIERLHGELDHHKNAHLGALKVAEENGRLRQEVERLERDLNAAMSLLMRYDELYPGEFDIRGDESRSK